MEKKVSGKHSCMNGFAMMKGRVATVVLASALLLGGGLTAQAQNAALTTCSQSAATAIFVRLFPEGLPFFGMKQVNFLDKNNDQNYYFTAPLPSARFGAWL